VRGAAALLFVLAAAAPAAAAPRAEEAIRESVLRLAQGDVVGAEAQAKEAVAADPGSARALQQLARSANAALDFSAAEDAATRGLALSGPLPALLCLRSEARAGRGDYAGALADAEQAASINPGSGAAALRRAVAEEALGRPKESVLASYARAAELDASNAAALDAARARLDPPRRRRGPLWPAAALALLAVAAAAWLMRRGRRPEPSTRSVPARLPGAGRLSPRDASRALAAAAASAPGPEESRALAESLYERLTGRPPYPPEEAVVARSLGRFAPPSSLAAGLPVGVDAFFARALDPDPARRFRSGAELAGAFRSLVEPAVD
jgi:tetratricopeptide (TPR) repeat protein